MRTKIMYEVEFEVFVEDAKESRFEVGTAKAKLDFVPTVSMHLGKSQLLTVCQVHWIGQSSFKVDCVTISCQETYPPIVLFGNLELLKEKIKEVSPSQLKWEFVSL